MNQNASFFTFIFTLQGTVKREVACEFQLKTDISYKKIQ